MRALTYHGSHDVRIETVDDPAIHDPDDVIIRVTATAICGADLHLYRGKMPNVKLGDILGHEFMGEVVDTGPQVTGLNKGDRVVVTAVIACGECYFCQRKLHAACERTRSVQDKSAASDIPPGAAIFGYGHQFGGVPGGQAEYVRVPKANSGPIRVPHSLDDEQVLFLGNSLPAAYQATLDANIGPGDSVAIFGAGPIGMLAAACARLLGAEQLFMVDHHAYRLDFAQRTYDAIPINFDEVNDPAQAIIEHTAGHRGVDAVIDAVGFEAKGGTLETVLNKIKFEPGSSVALRQCIAAVRRGGFVSVPGGYSGLSHGFPLGDAFDKGLTFRMGQSHVHPYLAALLEHIEQGALQPNLIISHRMSLEEAAAGYLISDRKEEECRKVILRP